MKKKWLIIGGIIVAGLTSCNKDNVIISETDVADPTTGKIKVYEYTPAPGQFINETTGNISAAEAAAWAEDRLLKNEIVSLGAFGGYIVVGFRHTIGDFIVKGNAFSNSGGASNEPGVVYVMQDTNGNGLPDDIWYELRGSATDAETTIADYTVTYFRPDADCSDVKWRDNRGNEGVVSYMASTHNQPTYYPAWIEDDSYTLSGTFVKSDIERDEAGQWLLKPLAFGYVDNIGSNNNVFYLADAMSADRTPVELDYVDFIKIQTAVQGQCGPLGELSTEIVSISEK